MEADNVARLQDSADRACGRVLAVTSAGAAAAAAVELHIEGKLSRFCARGLQYLHFKDSSFLLFLPFFLLSSFFSSSASSAGASCCWPGPGCQHDMRQYCDKLLFPITIYWSGAGGEGVSGWRLEARNSTFHAPGQEGSKRAAGGRRRAFSAAEFHLPTDNKAMRKALSSLPNDQAGYTYWY